MACSSSYLEIAPFLTREEHEQKDTDTVRLLSLLDPDYDGSRMDLRRTLTLHHRKRECKDEFPDDHYNLLTHVISMRQRDYAYNKTLGRDDEPHAYVIRCLMQLCRLYRPDTHSECQFEQYIRDGEGEPWQKIFDFTPGQQQRRRSINIDWRRGSISSASSETSSGFNSRRNSYSSATSTSSFDTFSLTSTWPQTAPPRLESGNKYVPSFRRGSSDNALQLKSWR
jgi:hypothetical protein